MRRATFGDQLRRNAARLPDRPAIVALHSPAHERRVLTYRGAERAGQPPRRSRSRGEASGTGDVVATMGRNTPESIVAFWAAAKLGAAVTGRQLHLHRDARSTTSSATPRPRRSSARTRSSTKIDGLDEPLPNLTLRIVNDAYTDTAPADWERFSALARRRRASRARLDVDERALGIIPYTSGTEALPKAVAIPQRNYFVSMIPSYVTGIGLVEDDVWYYTMPFHTIAGMGMQIAPAVASATRSCCRSPSTRSKALAAFIDEQVTVVGQTPTFYLQVIQAPGFDVTRPVRASAGRSRTAARCHGPCSRHSPKVAPDLEWVTLWSQSELTQTPTIGRFRSLDDVPNHDPSWIGRPTAQLEVRVVDADGNDAHEGEIICRSPGVMRGYYKNPEKTAEVLRDGWLHTGDNVRIDDDGNLYFVDRQKDMIKTGGMNVSSVEVERVLYQHEAVLEVAVVGVADDYWSQVVTAFVVAPPRRDDRPRARCGRSARNSSPATRCPKSVQRRRRPAEGHPGQDPEA